MRTPLTFPCAGGALVGALDDALNEAGLLVVSGGNEIRSGAHRGMARLAELVAADGWPVFRFDRRGVGDSPGENVGWRGSAEDIAAAASCFRSASPRIKRLIGFGNCDAATALALFGRAAGIDALVLANPWVVERAAGDPPPAAAIRARYAERLRSPAEWARVLRGAVDLRKLARGLRALASPPPRSDLPARFAAGIAGTPTTIILARGDATAVAYRDVMRGLAAPEPVIVETDSHSFARVGDLEMVERTILAVLRSWT